MYKDFFKSFLWLPSVLYMAVYWQSIFFGAAFPDDSYVIQSSAKDFNLWYTVSSSLWSPYSLFCQILVIALILSIVLFYKRIPLFSLGLMWFFLTILPVIQIIPLFSVAAVRYLYISSLGLSLSVFSLILYFRKFISNKILIILLVPIFVFL